MHTKLIFKLSLFGLLMAVATVFWIPSTVEPVLWLVIFFICAYVIGSKCTQRFFLHGFFLSVLNSVYITAAHVIFFETYIANHNEELIMMNHMPIPYSPRIAMMVIGPAIGIASGIVLGLFCVIAAKLLKRKKERV